MFKYDYEDPGYLIAGFILLYIGTAITVGYIFFHG